MTSGIKLRQPGKPVFERHKPKLTLVPSVEQKPISRLELSEDVKEMFREMRQQKRAAAKEFGRAGCGVRSWGYSNALWNV